MKNAALASVMIALFALGISSEALAQDEDADDSAEKDNPNAGKVKNYDFTGDEIDGDLVKPDGDFLATRKYADHGNLIRIRQEFLTEILKSANDL